MLWVLPSLVPQVLPQRPAALAPSLALPDGAVGHGKKKRPWTKGVRKERGFALYREATK